MSSIKTFRTLAVRMNYKEGRINDDTTNGAILTYIENPDSVEDSE